MRDVAVLELLFATGVRVSELCSITCENLNLQNQVVLIKGKGSKERCIYISSPPVISALASYSALRTTIDSPDPYFFLNRDKHRLSEQSVRRIICRYTPTDAARFGVSGIAEELTQVAPMPDANTMDRIIKALS